MKYVVLGFLLLYCTSGLLWMMSLANANKVRRARRDALRQARTHRARLLACGKILREFQHSDFVDTDTIQRMPTLRRN